MGDELGLLPLDLEQAGAYVEDTGMALGANRDLLLTRRGQVLGRGTPAFYRDTVAATFGFAHDQAAELSSAAAGHAMPRRPAAPATAALLLADGGSVSAWDLLAEQPGAHSSFPLPTRVILSACDSAGAGDAGGGEWLGLGPAALWAGAETVIAATWPILDHPTTAQLDDEITQCLRRDPDPAAGLRDPDPAPGEVSRALAPQRATDGRLER